MTIEIKPYIESLEALKDYMWYYICSKEVERKVLDIYIETGVLMYMVEKHQTFYEWLDFHGWKYEL